MHLYMGHFWSLCLEEQFYLLWPFIVYRVRKRETLMKICMAVIVLSPVLRAFLSLVLPHDVLNLELLYRSLPTRLDALLIGGFVALGIRGKEENLLRKSRRLLLVGTSLLFCALYFAVTRMFHVKYEDYPSTWIAVCGFTLIDLFAAALILECIHSTSLLGRMLSWRPLRLLGLISYGFYMYHDLFHDFYSTFAERFFPAHVVPTTMAIAFIATLLLATVSYVVMERPLLRLKDRFTSQVHTSPGT